MITDKFTISIFYQFYLYCLVQVLQTTLADNPTDYNGSFKDKVYLSIVRLIMTGYIIVAGINMAELPKNRQI